MPLAISKDRWSQMFDGRAPVDAIHPTPAMESISACDDKEKFAHWEYKSRQATPTSHTLFIAQVGREAQILLELADHIFVGQKIIKIGSAAIPFILKRMKEQGGHWFWALSLLTGEDPVPRKSRGKVSAMRRAWLKWGSKRGYC